MNIQQSRDRLFSVICAGVSLLLSIAFSTATAQQPESTSSTAKAEVETDSKTSGADSGTIPPTDTDASATAESESVQDSSSATDSTPDATVETDSVAPQPSADSEKDVSELPAWVRRGDYNEGGSQFLLIESDPELNIAALDEALEQKMLIQVKKHLDHRLASGASDYLNIDDQTVRGFVVPERELVVTREYEIGDMHHKYAQLEISPQQLLALENEWAARKRQFRLWQTGLFGVGIFATLAIAFSFLRFNHATRGLHSGRLQFFCGVAILLIVVAGFYAGKNLPWY